jgi:hypothetical protein
MQMDFILHANEFEPGKSPKFLGQIQAISPHSGQFACAIATSSISAVFGAGPFQSSIEHYLPSPLLSFCLCHILILIAVTFLHAREANEISEHQHRSATIKTERNTHTP